MGSHRKRLFQIVRFRSALLMNLRWNKEKLRFIELDYVEIDNGLLL